MARFFIRRAQAADFGAIRRLAEQHNSINLPKDQTLLEKILERSHQSFDGTLKELSKRLYFFVLVDLTSNDVIGTSQIIAQNGTPEEPLPYFKEGTKTHASISLNRQVPQRVLTLGFDSEGFSEIGGFTVDPAYRRHPDRLGTQLSLIRFMFMSAYPHLFKKRIVAEMMPALIAPGRSLFWEAVGQKFIGMDYLSAEFQIRKNKEAFETLFPKEPIYVCLLPNEIQALIGQVGSHTGPAVRILKEIGFNYENRMDPFDAGPFLEADLSETKVFKQLQRLLITATLPETPLEPVLVMTLDPASPVFLRTEARCNAEQICFADKTVLDLLGVGVGGQVYVYSRGR